MRLPASDEVLVKVAYTGINGGCETFRVRGEHAFAGNQGLRDFPLGAEAVGVVSALGEQLKASSKLRVGSVVAVNGAGGFSEFVLASPSQCSVLEAEEPTAELCALALSGVTALVALTTGKLKAGEKVVVNAAAGGVGHLALQVALDLGADLVVAICGGAMKAEAVKSLVGDKLGRIEVIDYKIHDQISLDQELSRISPSGFDLVWDGVGGEMRSTLLNHMTTSGGRILQVGYISGYPHNHLGAQTHSEEEEIFWGGRNIELPDGRRIIGKIWPEDALSIIRSRKRVFKLYREGQIKVLIDRSRSFKGIESIPLAVEHMLEGQHIGKVVVEL